MHQFIDKVTKKYYDWVKEYSNCIDINNIYYLYFDFHKSVIGKVGEEEQNKIYKSIIRNIAKNVLVDKR